jgi:hypothetical protein
LLVVRRREKKDKERGKDVGRKRGGIVGAN